MYCSKMLTKVNKGSENVSKASEEYLKSIYLLYVKNNKVRVTDVANLMNCSKPSVTKQLSVLSKEGVIKYEAYSDIIITDKGIEEAKRIVESYNILYLLMKDIFKLDEDTSKIEADKIKNVVSEKSINAIAKYVYNTLGLKESLCDFDITNEKCRMCFNILKEMKGRSENA